MSSVPKRCPETRARIVRARRGKERGHCWLELSAGIPAFHGASGWRPVRGEILRRSELSRGCGLDLAQGSTASGVELRARMDTPWRIELLGRLRATQGDRVVTRFRAQKGGALLAYLAYHLDRPHPREELIELLWPEAEPGH